MSLTTHPHFKFTFSIHKSLAEPSTARIKYLHNFSTFNSFNVKLRSVVTRVSSSSDSDSGGSFDDTVSQQVSDVEASSSPISGDSYIGLFIRMLGLDNDILDREQAVDALWKYSLGGKKCIDEIMKSPGSVILTVNLLKSDSSVACEAAAGLLRMISSVNIYRDLVAESGAIEEITSLLTQSSLTPEVKEQSLYVLANLSVDEKLRVQIANSDLLPLLIKFLDDEEMNVNEAAGGVLANLALSVTNHKVMVEAGVIPPLAKFLRTNSEGSKVIKKEAQSALLELAKDDYYKILLIEEGLVLVPLVGAAAYKSFRPSLHSWPSLPDGSELNVKQSIKGPSRFGASELLVGLHVEDDKNTKLEEAKKNAIVGRTQQQFLARIGAIEIEDENNKNHKFTILPWVDGVARMVLILELEDESAIAKAAESIADASISEHMRTSFKEAGAVKNLVRLIDHQSEPVKVAVICALERLSISNDVCQRIEAEGVLDPLIRSLKDLDVNGNSTHMILNILSRILDPSKEMKSKFYDGPVNGSRKGWNEARTSASSFTFSSETIREKDLSDSTFISRLVEILTTSSPVLQTKAASILEFLTTFESCREKITSLDIESALNTLFQQKFFNGKEDMEAEYDFQESELDTLEIEEAGLAVSAASRLLTRLLDSEHFQKNINASTLTDSLRKILTSKIPLQYKDWIAACLVKLSFISGPTKLGSENPINTEVMLYETIPRLIEQIKDNYSPESQETAVIELNRIISEGVVDSTRAVANQGGIFPLVKLIEDGNGRAVDAGLAILYNLSMDAENHPAILAAGAVPVLRRIVLSKSPQWERALNLLRTLPT
ncbi:ARM repeat superfamily protein [Artemisia annua]|uniref:ARM repeat superfamily protein n=2 Tax=Artemisia annua TaxID=35608 RepID=A0A2U1L8I6_ARTAN|nr:ARM repeat superfamily protein [Artemisia annua]